MEQIYNFDFWKFQGEWKRSKIGIPGEWGKHQNCKGPPRNSEIPRGLEICMLGIPGGQGFSKLGNPGSGKKIKKFQGYIAETAWNSMPPPPYKTVPLPRGPLNNQMEIQGIHHKISDFQGVIKECVWKSRGKGISIWWSSTGGARKKNATSH